MPVYMNIITTLYMQLANWMCPQCVLAVKSEEDKKVPLGGEGGGPRILTLKEAPGVGCNCAACVAKR